MNTKYIFNWQELYVPKKWTNERVKYDAKNL